MNTFRTMVVQLSVLGVSCCDPEVKVAMRKYRHVRQGTGNNTRGQHPVRVAAEIPISADWFGFAAQGRNTRSTYSVENLYEQDVLVVCQSLMGGFAFLFEERLNNAHDNV